MTAFGVALADRLTPGTALLLKGPIGAGKTHLARAIIQSLLTELEDVPSPTYTLVQSYSGQNGNIWHADLYRLSDSSELVELGLDEAFETAIVIIEWPDRLPKEMRPDNSIEIEFFLRGELRILTVHTSDPAISAVLDQFEHA